MSAASPARPGPSRAAVLAAWALGLLLLGTHLSGWRPTPEGARVGWLPAELAWRLAWMLLAWAYLVWFTARVWRGGGERAE